VAVPGGEAYPRPFQGLPKGRRTPLVVRPDGHLWQSCGTTGDRPFRPRPARLRGPAPSGTPALGRPPRRRPGHLFGTGGPEHLVRTDRTGAPPPNGPDRCTSSKRAGDAPRHTPERLPETAEKKRAGPWGGDGPARGGVSTITLRKGCCVHQRETTTQRSHPATGGDKRTPLFRGRTRPKPIVFAGRSGDPLGDPEGCAVRAARRADPATLAPGTPVANTRVPPSAAAPRPYGPQGPTVNCGHGVAQPPPLRDATRAALLARIFCGLNLQRTAARRGGPCGNDVATRTTPAPLGRPDRPGRGHHPPHATNACSSVPRSCGTLLHPCGTRTPPRPPPHRRHTATLPLPSLHLPPFFSPSCPSSPGIPHGPPPPLTPHP
jgi:hypothetical protein